MKSKSLVPTLLKVFVIYATLNVFTTYGASAQTVVPEAPPLYWGSGSYGFSTTGEYFTSSANYDQVRGSYTQLLNNAQFSYFESRARARYALTPQWSFFAGGGFTFAQVAQLNIEKTNSALTDLFLGVDFLLWKKWVRIIPELEGSFALTSVDPQQIDPVINDSVSYMRAGVFLFKPFRYITLRGYIGAHIPLQDLATRMMYSAGAEIPLGKLFSVSGSLDGYEAVMSDAANINTRTQTTLTANAGSQRFWAYEPALMEARGWLSFKPAKDLALRVGYSKTLDGLRTAEGQSFLFALSYQVPGSKSVAVDPTSRRRRQESNERFEVDLEETDPELFEDEDEELSPPPPPRRSNKRSLDETEKMLERKRR